MMEETPRRQLRSIDPETLWVAYGYGGSEGYAYVFPKAQHVNVGIGYVLEWFRDARRRRTVGFAAAVHRRAAATRRARGRVEPRAFHAVPDPGGRAAAEDGDAPRAARRRRRRVRQRHHRRGHLLRDGLGRAGRANGGPQAATKGYERRWRREIGAELRDAVLVQRHVLTTPAPNRRARRRGAPRARRRRPADPLRHGRGLLL